MCSFPKDSPLSAPKPSTVLQSPYPIFSHTGVGDVALRGPDRKPNGKKGNKTIRKEKERQTDNGAEHTHTQTKHINPQTPKNKNKQKENNNPNVLGLNDPELVYYLQCDHFPLLSLN